MLALFQHPRLTLNRWNLQYDYTNGQLSKLVDIIIASKAKLFVCAIGVPPKEVIERLHKAGIVVMKYVFAVSQLTSKCPIFFLSQYGRASEGMRIASIYQNGVLHHKHSMLPRHSISVRLGSNTCRTTCNSPLRC